MKSSQLTLLASLLATLLLRSGVSSCNRGTPDPYVVPDLTFKATISGAESRTVDDFREGNTTTNFVVNGSVNSAAGLMLIQATELQVYTLSFSLKQSSLTEGTFKFNESPLDFASYNDQVTGASYRSTSGTLTITKAELFQDVGSNLGTADDYFIDGSFSVEMADPTDPSKTITATGEFEGVNIKVQ